MLKKIVLDTDPGIDDAQAIAFAMAHPGIELLGLTSVFGNASIDVTTSNAVLLTELFGHPGLPVARGAGIPLVQDLLPPADFVHGADGLGNLDLPAPSGETLGESAAEYIVRLTSEHPGEITLVAVGPLTNIAQAVELDPMLPDRVSELIVMGGTVDEPGNVTPLAEANFYNDPHAADQVLGQNWPVTVIGLDVTHQILLTDSDLAQLRDAGGDVGKFLWESSRFYVDFYTSKGAASDAPEPSCAMHDASALVYAVRPDLFDRVSGGARVITEGMAAGQLALDRKRYDYARADWADRPDCFAAMQVRADEVKAEFIGTLVQRLVQG